MTSRLLARAALGICAVMWAGHATAQSGARAVATLTYDGRSVNLDRVLVVQSGNEEGLEDAPQLRIFLSDKDIPLTVAEGASILDAKQFVRQCKFNGVAILADRAGASKRATVSLLNAAGLERGSFVSVSSTDGFSRLQVNAARASGVFDIGEGSLHVTGTFDAPVTPNPVTADLKGRAAAESAPAKAFLAFWAALAKGDMAALANTATAVRVKELNDFRSAAGEAAFRQAMASRPSGSALARSIQQVIVRGEAASVVLQSKEVDRVVLEGGSWKVD